MGRITARAENGEYVLKDATDLLECTQRLGRYEDLYEAVCRKRDKAVEDMEKLKRQGKNKTVTYRQLLADKLMLETIIGYFKLYGTE